MCSALAAGAYRGDKQRSKHGLPSSRRSTDTFLLALLLKVVMGGRGPVLTLQATCKTAESL